MRILTNSFSLQMFEEINGLHVQFVELNERPNLEGVMSYIGHQDTANVLGVPMNRAFYRYQKGDEIIIAQLVGGRLAEGTTTLPEGFHFKFIRVVVFNE